MRGKITQWKEDKGFGFITSEENGDRIFFHISDVKTKSKKPKKNDVVIYQSTFDSQGRLKAKSIIIEGVVSSSKKYSKKQIYIEAPQKDVLDYLAIFLLIATLLGVGYVFIQSGSIENLMPAGVIFVIAVFLLNRSKNPKEKSFSCSRCRKISNHNQRTISAWKNGFLKLYCNACHHKWLENKPKQVPYTSASRGGCFGILALLVILPIIVGSVGMYQWVI